MTDPILVTGLSAQPLDVAGAVARIRRDDCGGLVAFEGSTRSPDDGAIVQRLDYEAYEERAEKQLDQIAREAVRRFDLGGAVALHRTGAVPPGEPSVLVAAAAPHRAEAFEAARWLIDTIKAEVAVWKKQVTAEGEAWVGEGRA